MQVVTGRKTVKRATNAQIKCLIAYIKANPDLLKAKLGTPNLLKRNLRKWEILAKILNKHGCDRSVQQWRHTWRDLKKRAKAEDHLAKQEDDYDNFKPQYKEVFEAIAISDSYDPAHELPWTSNELWIDPDVEIDDDIDLNSGLKINPNVEDVTDDETALNPEDDPLYEVEYLDEQNQEDQYSDDEQKQEQSEDTVELEQEDEHIDHDYEVSITQNSFNKPEPMPQRKRSISKSYSTSPQRSKINKNKTTHNSNFGHSAKQVSKHSGIYKDRDVLNALNRFIDYEKEKDKQAHERDMMRLQQEMERDKLAHEREMIQIEQKERIVQVLERMTRVLERVAPSIKNCLDKSGYS